MNKIRGYMLLALLIVGASTLVLAQLEGGVKADVPFKFYAGNKLLPAGHYEIKQSDTGENVLTIRNDDTGAAMLVDAEANERTMPSDKSELVFTQIGNDYFLSDLWVGGDTSGVHFPKSQVERKAEQKGSARHQVTVKCKP